MNLAEFTGCWFAVQVRPNYEQLVATVLHNKGYEEFLPLVTRPGMSESPARGSKRILYPGYVFCRFDPNVGGPIVTTQGVIRIVGNGIAPIPIEDDEIAKIRLIVQSKLPAYPWPFRTVGEKVLIVEGPLSGVEGLITKVKNVHRLIVSIAFLQRSAAVEIDASWVGPLVRTAV